MPYVEKDPNDRRTFALDYSGEVGDDPITGSEWEVPSGIAEVTPRPSFDATRTRIKLRGGVGGSVYRLHNSVTTRGGDALEKTLRVWVKEA